VGSTATGWLHPRHHSRVPHIPDFLWSFVGSLNFLRLSLKRAARGSFQSCVQEIRGISLVFREMWDTAGLPLKPVAGQQIHRGAPCSHQRTWAENDGRSPTTAFCAGPCRIFIRSERLGGAAGEGTLAGC
jgi:hypothetical protein